MRLLGALALAALHVRAVRYTPPERRSFLVTDDDQDAPDGAVVEIDGRGWYRRSGDSWVPCERPPEGIP